MIKFKNKPTRRQFNQVHKAAAQSAPDYMKFIAENSLALALAGHHNYTNYGEGILWITADFFRIKTLDEAQVTYIPPDKLGPQFKQMTQMYQPDRQVIVAMSLPSVSNSQMAPYTIKCVQPFANRTLAEIAAQHAKGEAPH